MHTYTPALPAACAAAIAFCAPAAHAQLTECARIAADAARLSCYDALAGRPAPSEPVVPSAAATPGVASAASSSASLSGAGDELDHRWQLSPELKTGILELKPYRPVYALVRATNRANTRAQSPTRPFDAADAIALDHAEIKFQLSLKTKLLENVLGSRGDMWFGYTQRSYWQAGNQRYSSLFRESNYEPELMFVHPVNFSVGGLNVRYAGASLSHQSNGQSGSFSRSWNRVIGDIALQYADWTINVRPWARVFTSSGSRNDNPDILDYVGRGELAIERRIGGHVLSANLRHTLRGGSRSRGSARADWAFPLLGGMKGHLQLFTGYGESLIDYNHSQTSVSLGVSFFD